MKVALITTFSALEENQRIEEEVIKLGHEFEIIDLDNFSFSIGSEKLVVDGLTDLVADIVIMRGIFHSQKAISVVVNSLRKKGIKVFDNNFLEHRYSIDKATDLIKLSLAKIPTPKTLYFRTFTDYPKAVKALGFPLVIKSTRMGKGASVFKIENQKGLNAFIKREERLEKTGKSFLIQEFIPYVYDLRALVIGENVFTMQRIPAEGEFRANFSLGGKVEVFNLDEAGKDLARRALRAVDMSVGGVDILITKDNMHYILEVNHTAGFLGMEKATGKNIGALYINHAIAHAK